jgi:hypothetical protein
MDNPYPITGELVYHLGLSIRDAGPCGLNYYITMPANIFIDPDWWQLINTSGLSFTTNDGTGCQYREYTKCTYPIVFTATYRLVDSDPEVTSSVTITILGCA